MIKCSPKSTWCLKVSYAPRMPAPAERIADGISPPRVADAYRFETLYRLETDETLQSRYRLHRQDVSTAFEAVREAERWISDTGWLTRLNRDKDGNEALDVIDPEGLHIQRVTPALFADDQHQSQIISLDMCLNARQWMPLALPIEHVVFQGDRLVIRVNGIPDDKIVFEPYREIVLALPTGKLLTDWESAEQKDGAALAGLIQTTLTIETSDMSSANPSDSHPDKRPGLFSDPKGPFGTITRSLQELTANWQSFLIEQGLLQDKANLREPG